MTFLEFVEGPMFLFAAAVFVVGAIWRVVGIIRIGKKRDLAPARGSASLGFVKGNLRHFFPRGTFAQRTWMHLLGGYGFHLGLFALRSPDLGTQFRRETFPEGRVAVRQ